MKLLYISIYIYRQRHRKQTIEWDFAREEWNITCARKSWWDCERVGTKISSVSQAIEGKEKDNIYRRCDVWERDCFPKKKKIGKHPIENKPYFC